MNIDTGRRRALSAFPKLRNCSVHWFQPRTSLISGPSRLQSTTTTLPPFRVVRTVTNLSEQMTTPNPDYEDFLRYTSRQWLWGEEQQLKDRYKAFNVTELQSRSIRQLYLHDEIGWGRI